MGFIFHMFYLKKKKKKDKIRLTSEIWAVGLITFSFKYLILPINFATSTL